MSADEEHDPTVEVRIRTRRSVSLDIAPRAFRRSRAIDRIRVFNARARERTMMGDCDARERDGRARCAGIDDDIFVCLIGAG